MLIVLVVLDVELHSSDAELIDGVPPPKANPPPDCVPAEPPACLAVFISLVSAQDTPFHVSVSDLTVVVYPPEIKTSA